MKCNRSFKGVAETPITFQFQKSHTLKQLSTSVKVTRCHLSSPKYSISQLLQTNQLAFWANMKRGRMLHWLATTTCIFDKSISNHHFYPESSRQTKPGGAALNQQL